MSVVMESQKGDRLFCVGAFHATPDGVPFEWDGSHHFQIGEKVIFCGHRINDSVPNHPSRYMVLFEATDGRHYAAVESYFVIEDTWTRLADYFRNQSGDSRIESPKIGAHAASGSVSTAQPVA